MDLHTLIAIYTRAKQIFEVDNKDIFLSFPINFQYTFSSEDLNNLTSKKADEVRDAYNTISSFSRYVNIPPRGVIFNPYVEEDYLWNVYSDIIKYMDIAEEKISEEEKERYEKAKSVLYNINDINNSVEENNILSTYNGYKDKVYNLKQEYQTKYLEAQNSNDIRWENDSILIKEKMDSIEKEWITSGNKRQVEDALKIIQEIEQKSPDIVKRKFNPKIDIKTDINLSEYAHSYIFPSNISETGWCKIILKDDEIKKLIEESPKELKELIKNDNSTSNAIEEVELEYRVAKIVRPWLDKSVLKSRYWKLSQNYTNGVISFRDNKYLGRFPSYTSGLILCRNLKITYNNCNEERKTENNNNESLVKFDLNNNKKVSVLALICKNLSDIPNPNPNIEWPNGFNQTYINIKNDNGGDILATVDGKEILSCYIPQGKEILFSAYPKESYIPNGWIINGNKENKSDSFKYIAKEDKLEVEVLWRSMGDISRASYILSQDKKTVVKWIGKEEEIDMNNNSELYSVTTIGKSAFENNEYIRFIKVGNKVKTIENKAFKNCLNLELVTIPSETSLISDDAFEQDIKVIKPSIIISDNNKNYKILEDEIVEKKTIHNFYYLECNLCGLNALFEKAPHTELCPNCGTKWNLEKLKNKEFIYPSFETPFSIGKNEIEEKLRKTLEKKWFVPRKFKRIFDNIHLEKINIPIWLYNLEYSSKYTGRKGTYNKTSYRNSEGEEDVKIETEWQEVSGEYNGYLKDIGISASTLDTRSITLRELQPTKENFSKDITYILNSKGSKECLEEIKKETDKKISDGIKTKIGGDVQEIKDVITKYKSLNRKFIWKGLWIKRIDYKRKYYKVEIDGCTGDIKIETPIDKFKVWSLVLLILTIIFGIILLLANI